LFFLRISVICRFFLRRINRYGIYLKTGFEIPGVSGARNALTRTLWLVHGATKCTAWLPQLAQAVQSVASIAPTGPFLAPGGSGNPGCNLGLRVRVQ
jgi:hypothetical protein